jgi:hypothetical protein
MVTNSSGDSRVLIVCDSGGAWYVRRVRLVKHDLDRDEKVYYCDKHLAGPFTLIGDAVEVVYQWCRKQHARRRNERRFSGW